MLGNFVIVNFCVNELKYIICIHNTIPYVHVKYGILLNSVSLKVE